MTLSRTLIPLGGLLVTFFILSSVFHSSDPGSRGIIADISFFGFMLLLLYFLVIGIILLLRRGR